MGEDEVMEFIRRQFSGFAIAFSMLTTLPFFKIHDFRPGCNGAAVMYYPIIGLILGGIVYGLYSLVQGLFPEVHLAVLLFGLWVLLYGAIHLDGFADTVDGLFAPKERALEVMKDPNVGAMGMIFTVLFLVAKLSSFVYLPDMALFLLVPLLGRFSAVAAIRFFPYVRKEGMGSLAKAELTAPLFWTAAFATLLIGAALGAALFAVMMAVSVVATWLLGSWLTKRFGGLSGDMYGFIIELNELLLLNLLILAGMLS